MQISFSFESILLFGALAVMLLSGVLLRAKVPFFQNKRGCCPTPTFKAPKTRKKTRK
jgi:hypothetical protein